MIALAALALPAQAWAKPRETPPPTGELVLDMADPIVAVQVGKVPMRLRVGLEQKRLVELNPAAVERLVADPPHSKFRFEDGFDAAVGRVTLKGIAAAAPVTIDGRSALVLISSHGRECCPGVDGEIGIGLLPYATIRFIRSGMADPGASADFLIEDSDEHGPQSPIQLGKNQIFLQFALRQPESVASSSAGAILAHRHGGRLGATGVMTGAFGVARPTQLLNFPRSIRLAGFRFESLLVRTADFAGKFAFPADPADPGDIVVRRKVKQQDAWPVIQIGADRLQRCSEIRYDSIARKLSLHCAPDGAS